MDRTSIIVDRKLRFVTFSAALQTCASNFNVCFQVEIPPTRLDCWLHFCRNRFVALSGVRQHSPTFASLIISIFSLNAFKSV